MVPVVIESAAKIVALRSQGLGWGFVHDLVLLAALRKYLLVADVFFSADTECFKNT